MNIAVATSIVELQLLIRKLQEKAAGELSQDELSKLLSEISWIAYKGAFACLHKGEPNDS